jgi:solute carrier family 26 (sodium-independent sulfate anion transporter), member 11
MKLKQGLKTLVQRVFHIPSEKERKEQKQHFEQQAREALVSPYFEEDPNVLEWLQELAPSRAGAKAYTHALFPSASWARRYNLHWMIKDAIAGVTVGLVVVPQAMAYALLARLSPGYGLYTSFTGVALYWLFGTSKDIVIGVSVHIKSLHMSRS